MADVVTTMNKILNSLVCRLSMIHQHRALARWDWQGADTFSASHRRDEAALPPSFSSARQVGAPRRRKARHVYNFKYPKLIVA
jgi:hypothetical protein